VMSYTICEGQKFTLPWGETGSQEGVYINILKSIEGCDSLKWTVNLTVNKVVLKSVSASICSGENYTLPSGRIVNATGVYQDTLKYQSGCDSLITTVDLSLNSITRIDQKMIICAGEKYTLPTGKIVSTSGIYNDTLKYSGGC